MLTQVEATPKGAAKYLPPWSKTWLVATTRPFLTTYQSRLQSEGAELQHAFVWIVLSAMTGGTVNALGSLLTQSPANQYFDLGLLIAIPAFALLIAGYWALFAGGTYLVARLLKGQGTYRRLAYVFASFSAPLLIVVSVLSLMPRLNMLLLLVYLYWFGLYVVSLQAVQQVSRLKAFFIVLITFLGMSSCMLGIIVLVDYLGRYGL